MMSYLYDVMMMSYDVMMMSYTYDVILRNYDVIVGKEKSMASIESVLLLARIPKYLIFFSFCKVNFFGKNKNPLPK